MTDYIKEPHTTIFTGPTGFGKIHLVLDLTNILTTSLFSAQHFNGIKHIIPGAGSKMMIRFGL